MMKKKTLATLLTLTMLSTAAVPVFAADKTNETTVTYTVASTYTITISDTVNLNAAGKGSISVAVETPVITPEEAVVVSITKAANDDNAGNTFRLKGGNKKDGKADYVVYTLQKEGATENVKLADELLKYTMDGNENSVKLNIEATGTPEVAGDHTDQLTFTSKVAAK